MIPETIKLLIVEDDPATALLYSEYLNGHGFTIRHVDRVGDALHELKSANFDAILLDLNVPDSVGLATLEKIAPMTETPIIVMTGSIGEEMAQKAKLMGAADYLMKEKVHPKIVERVLADAVLQHKRYRLRSLTERFESIAGRFDG